MRFERGRRPGLPPKAKLTPRLLLSWIVLLAVVLSVAAGLAGAVQSLQSSLVLVVALVAMSVGWVLAAYRCGRVSQRCLACCLASSTSSSGWECSGSASSTSAWRPPGSSGEFSSGTGRRPRTGTPLVDNTLELWNDMGVLSLRAQSAGCQISWRVGPSTMSLGWLWYGGLLSGL